MRFQVLFHSPPGVLFTFPSRYWFAIGHRVVFSLSGWSPMIPAGFHVPRRTQVPPRSMSSLRIRVSHPLRIPFPWDSPDSSCHLSRRSYNPGLCPVWAPPLSLAATYGIDFSFSSCRYLDVSVPCVTSLSRTALLKAVGSPIRISTDLCLLTAPRSVSSFVTSFFGS